MTRRILGILGGRQLRAVAIGHFSRIGERLRQFRQGRRILQGRRWLAGDPFIGGAAGGQLRLRRRQFGLGARQARLGLGHIGARDFANFKAVTRGLEVLRQHVGIIAADIHHFSVAADIHEGGDGIDEHSLFDRAQGFAAGIDQRRRLVHRTTIIAAAINRLAGGDRVILRR